MFKAKINQNVFLKTHRYTNAHRFVLFQIILYNLNTKHFIFINLLCVYIFIYFYPKREADSS